MSRRLRIGVIGLGRRWPRYRQALEVLRDVVRTSAVCDVRPERAEQEAALLHCQAAGGVVELIHRDDVDAVLLPGGPWFGLWPLEQAVRRGLPVLCAVSPVEDEANVDALLRRLDPQARVHMALWPALGVVVDVLADRLDESLGAARFVHAAWSHHGGPRAAPGLSSPAVLALLRGCADLFGSDPVALRCVGAEQQPGFAGLVLEFEGGRVAHLTLWDGPAARASTRLQVEGEKGSACVEVPRLLEWSDAEGRHSYELPGGPAEVFALDRFAQSLREGTPAACDLSRACAALGWLRAARRSRQEGRRVELSSQ